MTRVALALSAIAVGAVVSSCAVGVRQPATDITATSATLNGKVLSTAGGPGSYRFIYTDSAGKVGRTAAVPIEFESGVSYSVSAPVSALDPGARYRYVACAEDGENPANPFCSPEQTFTTDLAPARDAVTGQATDCLPGPVPDSCFSSIGLSVDARSDPGGAQPSGTVSWFDNGGSPDSTISTSTEVTCLAVNGNVAVIGVAGTSSFFGTTVPTAGLVRVADLGGPDSGRDTFAFATRSGDPSDPPIPGPTVCSSFPSGPSGHVNDFGDLMVIDAHPSPTSR
jgi:hypothetical protein